MDSPKGEAREAKSLCRHGEFKAWVEANCRCGYRTAAVYMQVAREWEQKCSTLHISDPAEFSLRDFLGNKPEPKSTSTKPPVFTKDDAEYALKINARAER